MTKWIGGGTADRDLEHSTVPDNGGRGNETRSREQGISKPTRERGREREEREREKSERKWKEVLSYALLFLASKE